MAKGDKGDAKNSGPRISLYMDEREERTGPKQMEERQLNMWGVKRSLGVRSLQAKIEERVLRRIGYVLRLENARPTKRVTFGLYVPPVTPTSERKPRHGTLEYRRKTLNEAGLDADSREHLVWDRSNWREIIRKRTRHIEEWEGEQAKCHGNQRLQMSRSQKNDEQQRSLVCQWTEFEKVHRKTDSKRQSVNGAIQQ